MFARLGDTFDDLLGNLGIELARSQIVHKKERGGALDGDVVHAMIHQVAANRMMNVHLEGDFQFGAYAVDTGYKDRVFVLKRYREKAAKAADFAEHVLVESFVSQILDALFRTVSAGYVHARVGVGNGRICRWFLGHGAE
jgi:hypothetical protein